MTGELGSRRLVVASHNRGKVGEIVDLLAPFGLEVVSAGELGLPEPEETGSTYAENAEIKALASARTAGCPALADDSGVSVTALGGEPGIHSARWAGPDRDFGVAMAKVQDALGRAEDRSAAFICDLCLAWPDGSVRHFEGRVEGTLVWPPRGDRGFGYDPMFLPNGYAITFGEMEPARKHEISHRARAFRKLVDQIFGRP